MPTLQEQLIKTYQDLLIAQYRDKPKAMATIRLFVTEVLSDLIINQVRDGFELNTCLGKQLDILGKYIGLSRMIRSVTLAGKNFGYIPYHTSSSTFGNYGYFSRYGDPPLKDGSHLIIGSHFIRYEESRDGISIDDDTYRMLLKLKIIQNISNFSTESIYKITHDFFPKTVNSGGKDLLTVTDNKNMSITFTVNDPTHADTFVIAKEKGLLPVPMGVRAILA